MVYLPIPVFSTIFMISKDKKKNKKQRPKKKIFFVCNIL